MYCLNHVRCKGVITQWSIKCSLHCFSMVLSTKAEIPMMTVGYYWLARADLIFKLDSKPFIIGILRSMRMISKCFVIACSYAESPSVADDMFFSVMPMDCIIFLSIIIYISSSFTTINYRCLINFFYIIYSTSSSAFVQFFPFNGRTFFELFHCCC